MDHVNIGRSPSSSSGTTTTNIAAGSNSSSQLSDQDDSDLRRGPWTDEEDFTLINYISHHGEGRWNTLARTAGLKRTGKSCRLRWLNYLRPDVRRGDISLEEQLLILELHSRWGNRWSKIAQHLPGRTDNEIKNYWRTRVQKHAKQLKCDVNSKKFKDTMRYLWMPRLVERIQAAAATATATATATTTTSPNSSSPDPTCYNHHNNNYNIDNIPNMNMDILSHLPEASFHINNNMVTNFMPENSSTAASSDSFSDMTDCYNNYNYPVNNNQDYYSVSNNNISNNYGDTLTSPTGYFNQGLDFQMMEQNNQWMDGGDVSDSLWNVEDVWFLQQQFSSIP